MQLFHLGGDKDWQWMAEEVKGIELQILGFDFFNIYF